MAIQLAKETRKRLIASIRKYADENFEEEMGDLKAGLFLDYCLKEIGPCVYNRAVADAQAYLAERVADLEGACYEPEFPYWKR